MECLPGNLRGRVYYQPTNEGIEKRIRERLEEIRKLHMPAPENKSSKSKKEP
jgi:putative ATPase